MKKSLIMLSAFALVFSVSGQAEAKSKKKASYEAAKKICLEETPSLAGRALQKCIKAKRVK